MKVQKWLKYGDRKYANKLLRNEALGNRANIPLVLKSIVRNTSC